MIYGDTATPTNLRENILNGTTIKDFEGIILKRIAWSDGTFTVTEWTKKTKFGNLYLHTHTKTFTTESEYLAWHNNLANGNGKK